MELKVSKIPWIRIQGLLRSSVQHPPGADPGFPIGGRGPTLGGHGPFFGENVCENERIGSLYVDLLMPSPKLLSSSDASLTF